MSVDLRALLEPLESLARDAGRHILEIYRTDFEVRSKADQTPVTAADMAAHRVIVEGLARLTPDIPIVSEESGHVPYGVRSKWARLWLVDPLDGTREFIKHNGEFTVNLALVDNHEPVVGVILVPVTDVCYFAFRNGGAFKQAARGQPASKIYTRPLDKGPVRVAGSRSYAVKPLQSFLRRLDDYEYLGIGSSLKSCLIAEGKLDVYPRLGPTSEWDTAAAQCILEEAGGRLTDLKRRALRYNGRPTLQNPPFIAFGDERYDWTGQLPRRLLGTQSGL